MCAFVCNTTKGTAKDQPVPYHPTFMPLTTKVGGEILSNSSDGFMEGARGIVAPQPAISGHIKGWMHFIKTLDQTVISMFWTHHTKR